MSRTMDDPSGPKLQPYSTPHIVIPPDERNRLARECGPDLEREQRRYRRYYLPKLMRQLRTRAERFCRFVNTMQRADYKTAGQLLRRYLRKEITPQDLCDQVNAHAKPVPWTLTVRFYGKNATPTFTYDMDAQGSIDAWRHLVILLSEGTALNRLKVCALSTCDTLFYDASPRGDRTTCSPKHKYVLASRAYRQKSKKSASSVNP